MGFREVSVVGVKEILRLWLLGHGQRDVGVSHRRIARPWRATSTPRRQPARSAAIPRTSSPTSCSQKS